MRKACSYLVGIFALSIAFAACGDEETGSPPHFEVDTTRLQPMCSDYVSVNKPYGELNLVDRFEATFELPAGARSFLLMAYSSGTPHTIETLTAPDGTEYDFLYDEELSRFHPAAETAVSRFPVTVDRLMLPPIPSLASMVQPGTYTIEGTTYLDEFCFYAVPTFEAGTDLRLNVHIAGVDGLTAQTAPEHEDWQAVLDDLSGIFEAEGITVSRDDIRYFDVQSSIDFSVIRQFDIFQRIVRSYRDDSDAVDDAMRLNVYLVRGFAGSLTGILGVSSGVPGAGGLHGTDDSGIVFGVEDYLGVTVLPDEIGGSGGAGRVSGNRFLGQVMAHEIGHYLGLFHTTETYTEQSDPLDDTVDCPAIYGAMSLDDVAACPDATNLMFPIALGFSQREISDLQVETLRLNPLLRP